MTKDVKAAGQDSQHKHIVRAGPHHECKSDTPDPSHHKKHIEPWLSALLQSDHLNLLIGSGFTTAVAEASETEALDMRPASFECRFSDAVQGAAENRANQLSREAPNIEDQISAIRELIGGLRVLASVSGSTDESRQRRDNAAQLLRTWESALDDAISSFLTKVLATEQGINETLSSAEAGKPEHVRRLLGGFLLPFASRATTRERLHIFTTNYDRLIEYGCDILGLRVIDRFVGNLAPIFRSSRLGIDLHYNPPGIRGEPRYLEGVVRLTKLHGSLDWRTRFGPSSSAEVQRRGLPFGAADSHPEVSSTPGQSVLIYPNPAKDTETLEYPYAELFRDFAAAACQPNSVVVTYGYGFGDDHVNRILRDMLSIPSTHLVIISYDDAGGRLQDFCNRVGHKAQTTLLAGPHFGNLETLVEYYLPTPAIDRTTWRMVDLLKRRVIPNNENTQDKSESDSSESDESQ